MSVYQNRRFSYDYEVDVCLVIDRTGSMRPILDTVKNNAVSLHRDIKTRMEMKGKTVSALRVRVIAFGEETVTLEGVEFGVLRTPGHSPDHICFVTPDDVCFAGDVLMTEDVLEEAMVPFVFDMADDLESKALVARTSHAAWILCHNGVVYGSAAELAEKNVARIRERIEACRTLVTGPMTYSEFYAAVVTAFRLPIGHPIRAQHLERYIRPYLEYLIDTGQVTLIDLDGAPGVKPNRH